MTSFYLINQTNGEEIVMDAVMTRDSTYKNKITSRPVESGFEVSDNSSSDNNTYTLECIISDSSDNQSKNPEVVVSGLGGRLFRYIAPPAPLNVEVETFLAQESLGKSERYKQSLLAARNNKDFLTLYSPVESIERLQIRSIKFIENAQITNAIRFSLSLQEIRVVSSKVVSVDTKRELINAEDTTRNGTTSEVGQKNVKSYTTPVSALISSGGS